MLRRILKPLRVLMFAVAAAAPVGSHAIEITPVIKAGYDVGGDTVVSVNVGGSTKTIKANDGFFVGGGASFLSDSKVLEIEVSLSYKFFNIVAQDGDIDWTLLPLDALVFYHQSNFRVGGGLTYHLNPTVKGRRAASAVNAKYDGAPGIVLQADYILDKRFNIGLRYTNVGYKLDSSQANSLATPATSPKASGIGIVLTLVGF